ncbi:hypothetical protein [Jannaschia marina]|uniref:hypothetical protein n=1 Tax=Jannaschia marina TaxID=2741674 RepID=UPI0015C8FB4B|nr:hypothetical protein [Jannaschia marina]
MTEAAAPPEMSTPDQLRVQGHLIRSTFMGSLSKDMVVGPYLTAFAVQVLLLSNGKISLFLAVLPLVVLLRYPFLDRIRGLPRQRVTLASRAVQLACLLLLLVLPQEALGLPGLIAIAVLFTFGNEFLQNAVWTNFVAEVAARGDRGRFLGRLRTGKQAFALLFALFGFFLVGETLDRAEHRILLLVVIALLLNSVFWLLRVPATAPPVQMRGFSGRGQFWSTVRHSPLMRRPLAIAVLSGVLTWPILNVYLLGVLNLPANLLMLMTVAWMLGPIFSVFLWGRQADALGERRIFRVYFLGALAALPLLLLVPDFAAVASGSAAWWGGVAAVLGMQFVTGILLAGHLMATTMYQARYVTEGAGFHALNILTLLTQLAGAGIVALGGVILTATTGDGAGAVPLGPIWVDGFKAASIGLQALACLLALRVVRGIPDG